MENTQEQGKKDFQVVGEFKRKVRETADHIRHLNETADIAGYSVFRERTEMFCREVLDKEYESILNRINFDSFDEEDYKSLERSGLKRKLFDYRARIYLDTLKVFAEKGQNLITLFDSLKSVQLPPIKHENAPDQTYNYFKNNFLI